MAEKNLNSRIVHKHDIEVNWSKATNFVPKIGEIIVYDPDENHAAARVKIGDGVKTVIELAFIDEAAKAALFEEIDMVDEKVETLGQLVGNVSVPEQIEEALLKTQADWEVNDETDPAYVKNRTHYALPDEPVVTDKAFTATEGQDWVRLDEVVEMTVGENYVMTLDGVSCTATAFLNSGASGPQGPACNFSKLGVWIGTYHDSYTNIRDFNNSGVLMAGGNHVFSLAKSGAIKQLDVKYLPDIVSNWMVNDPNSLKYIENRPFYEEYKIGDKISDHSIVRIEQFSEYNIAYLDTNPEDEFQLDNHYAIVTGDKTFYSQCKYFDWVNEKCIGNIAVWFLAQGATMDQIIGENITVADFNSGEEFLLLSGALMIKREIINSDSSNLSVSVYNATSIVHQLDPKFIPTAIEDQLISLLMDIDAFPAMTDSNGAVFTHNDAILLI